MSNPTYTDEELAAYFESADVRHSYGRDDGAPSSVLTEEDEGLAAFFHSPDAPTLDGSRRASNTGGNEEDEALAAFFNSPDIETLPGKAPSGDGAPPKKIREAPPPPPAPSRPPRAHQEPRRRLIPRALTGVIGLLLIGGILLAGLLLLLSRDLPSLDQIENPRNYLATLVTTADGMELARYYEGENRTWVPLSAISPHVQNALLATEDQRFRDHWGVDLVGIGGIARSLLTRGQVRGASTLTMQLARNLYRDQVGFDRSITRKIKEVITAVRIERIYTKDEILEAYLNTVAFRYNAFGIQAAAQTYFSKDASELDPAEAATLIGMLAANTRYDPQRNPEASRERRNVVLTNMQHAGVLTPEQTREYQESEIELRFDPYSHEDNLAPHFAEALRLWFREWCEKNGYDPYRDGLVIRTTIDSRMQALATEAVNEEMDKLQEVVSRAYGWREGSAPFGFWGQRRGSQQAITDWIVNTEAYQSQRREGTSREDVISSLRNDPVFMDSLESVHARIEAGLVAIDPRTGNVKAWVGGRDFLVDKFDHVAQARRQAGSTFKLFAYTALFDNGYAPERTYAVDAPFSWGNWSPQNSGGGYSGNITLASALQHSKNVVAARITQHVGAEEVKRYAERLGIRSPLEPVRSIALGTNDVTLLEMVNAFATVANYGVYHGPARGTGYVGGGEVSPHITLAISRIEDRFGNPIEEFNPPSRQELSPSTAYVVLNTMRGVVRGGTGQRLQGYAGVSALDLAGKTGTTQDNADGWFIAMNPNLVIGSWTGFGDRRLTYPNTAIGQGANTGLRNVGAFIAKLQTGSEDIRLDPNSRFEKPAGFVPPTLGGQVGGGSVARSDENSQARADDGRPARELLDRMNEAQGGSSGGEREGGGGRIGW